MAEATVIDSGSPARATDQQHAMEIAVRAAWEMEALLIAAKQALCNPEMMELTMRGLLARMNQLNVATMSALGDDLADLNEVQHIVCDAGIGICVAQCNRLATDASRTAPASSLN
jgi:hypothetical protein